MEIPSFYDPSTVGTLVVPQVTTAILEGGRAGFAPAAQDQQKIALILVDVQVDFVHTDGALAVPGAVDDTRRTIEWMYRNLGKITRIVASLDSHVPLQIFYPLWWVNARGEHPAPFTAITANAVEQGVWQPTVEVNWSRNYVRQLEESGKKTLIVWPHHTMLGTPGHAITPALYEAIAYHSAARAIAPLFLEKGLIPKTEHYSILEPEVKVPDEPMGSLNTALLEELAVYDLIYVAGQAKSHCVLETVTSLHHYFANRAPDRIHRWRFMTDCTSSVAHPSINFDSMANAQLKYFSDQGMRLVTSTDPIE